MDYLFARQVAPAEQNNLFGLKKSRNLLHTRKIVQKKNGINLGDHGSITLSVLGGQVGAK